MLNGELQESVGMDVHLCRRRRMVAGMMAARSVVVILGPVPAHQYLLAVVANGQFVKNVLTGHVCQL